MKIFEDRSDAGRQLARMLSNYAGRDDVVVLALPRGGVPVAFEVAKELGALLDVFVVRKLGVPWQEELAMGAIASGNIRVLNQEIVDEVKIPEQTIDSVAAREKRELKRREIDYRGGRAMPDLTGRTVIVVDDGIATGASARAAIAALRCFQPAWVVVAVPVAPPRACDKIGIEADEVVCAVTPEPFWAVGQWYEKFDQVEDMEVRDLLQRRCYRNSSMTDCINRLDNEAEQARKEQ